MTWRLSLARTCSGNVKQKIVVDIRCWANISLNAGGGGGGIDIKFLLVLLNCFFLLAPAITECAKEGAMELGSGPYMSSFT